MPEILEKESASYICVSPKMLALGTHSGTVHLLDLNGNEVRPGSVQCEQPQDDTSGTQGLNSLKAFR